MECCPLFFPTQCPSVLQKLCDLFIAFEKCQMLLLHASSCFFCLSWRIKSTISQYVVPFLGAFLESLRFFRKKLLRNFVFVFVSSSFWALMTPALLLRSKMQNKTKQNKKQCQAQNWFSPRQGRATVCVNLPPNRMFLLCSSSLGGRLLDRKWFKLSSVRPLTDRIDPESTTISVAMSERKLQKGWVCAREKEREKSR